MEKRKLRVALAQINSSVGDLGGNSKKIIDLINEAERRECDIVTFPELAITGYPPEDLLLKPKFIEDNISCLKEVVKQAKTITAIVGFVDKQKKEIYNSAALIYGGKILGIYHKMFLPNYGVFDEKRYFASGNSYLIAEIEGIYFSVNICEDIWQDEPVKKISTVGIKLLLNINASPYDMNKMNLRKRLLLRHAQRNNLIIAYNNLVGGQDELVFDGRSMVVSPKGIICQAKAFEEDLILSELDIPSGVKRTGRNVKIIKLPAKIKPKTKALVSKSALKEIPLIEEIYSALILGLKDYVSKNNFKKVIIGLSGGIDSTLTAAIAVDALGKENVVCVFMPSEFSSPESKEYSVELANNLGIELKEIPIQNIFETFKSVLKESFQGTKEGIAEENLQARIRGMLLMALSNKFGWLVVTTGNKSEMSTGYATLYGDMAGGFALIKDVPKTFVFELAKYFNKKSGKEVIPNGIIERAPTAELRVNQKDSDSLPAYEILDEIIKLYVEENFSLEEIIQQGIDRETAKKAVELIDKAEYKRRQSPPGVKITPRAFGKDRRMPITNRYTG